MAIQTSDALANARLDQIESTVGTGAIFEIFTGAQPATPATADSGTKLVSMTLASDWMNAATGRSKTKLGTWAGTGITGGNAGYWRLKSSGGTVHMQGSITATGGGGDMTLDNISIAATQTVTVNTFTLTDGNA